MTSNRNHALAAIEKAIENNRLTHALLLKGRNLNALRGAANHIAGRLLDRTPDAVATHPDLFVLQARNRMRQISVDHTRELIRKIQHTPSAGNRKVALIIEVDRMNHEAANAFLKTLEEPPLNTSIILTTAKPNSLLDTIVSRCLSFWFQELETPLEDEPWNAWKKAFRSWMDVLPKPVREQSEISERLMRLYGLLEGFQCCLERLSLEKREIEKAEFPEHTPEEEMVAMEVGLTRSIRVQLLAEIERSIRDFSVDAITSRDFLLDVDESSARYETSIEELEYLKGLLDVNLSNSKMLEVFFLKLLRIWSVRS
jgi:DNA polymerase III subunit delta'